MVIEMEHVAKAWLASKGNQVTVRMLDVKACCAPGVQEVLAVPGRPSSLEQYKVHQIDQINVYVQNNLCSKDTLCITLKGSSFLKSLSAKLSE